MKRQRGDFSDSLGSWVNGIFSEWRRALEFDVILLARIGGVRYMFKIDASQIKVNQCFNDLINFVVKNKKGGAVRAGRNFKLFLVCVFFLLFYFLNWTGFCFFRLQYIPDKVFFAAVIRQEIASGRLDVVDADESISKFFAENKDCCWVEVDPPQRGWLDVLLFNNYRRVFVRYRLNEQQAKNLRSKFYLAVFYMSSCGKVLRHAGGVSD